MAAILRLRLVVQVANDLRQQIVETTSEHDTHGQHQHTHARSKNGWSCRPDGGRGASDAPCTQ